MAAAPVRTDGRGPFLMVGLLWGLILGVVSYFASGELTSRLLEPERPERASATAVAASAPDVRESRSRVSRFEDQEEPRREPPGTRASIAWLILMVAGASIGALLPKGPRGSFLLGGLSIAAPGMVLSLTILAMAVAYPS